MLRPVACAAAMFLGLASVPVRADDGLAAKLRPILAKFPATAAVVVKHLGTGETFAHNPDVAMPTASLIKFPVMIEAYRQAAAGKIDLKAPVVLRKEDKVPGSGVLTAHFSDGASFPLGDAVHLMIALSDNTATNLVIDRIGIGSTAATMEAMGFPNTKIHSKVFRRDTSVFPERSKQFGLGSTTAREMVALFEKLQKRELVSPEAGDAMHAHLLACDDPDKFPRFLPEGTKVAFKGGGVDGVRTAAGIIETRSGPVAVCVLTSGLKDLRWTPDNEGNRLCADVAKAVYDVYDHSAPTTAAKP